MNNKIPIRNIIDTLGINSLYFYCLSLQSCGIDEATLPCTIYWDEYTYQSPFSRQAFYNFANECAESMKNMIGTYPYVKQINREHHAFQTYHRSKNQSVGKYEPFIFQTNCTHIKEFGVFVEELITEDLELTYTDTDGDGIFETVELTTTIVGLTDEMVSSLVIKEHDGDKCITPLDTEYDTSTGVITFTFLWYELVKDSLYKTKTYGTVYTLSPCDLNNFIASVDLYQSIKDECQAEVIVRYPADTTKCEVDCGYIEYPACATIIDSCEGLFKIQLMEWETLEDGSRCVTNRTSKLPCNQPLEIFINYKAGVDNDTILISAWSKLIASKFLVGEDCRCQCMNDTIGYYAKDMYGSQINNSIPLDWMNSTLGITRGAMMAYQSLLHYNITC